MSTDFSHKERAFVDALAAETGRSLEGWMVAIDGCGLAHRNDIIDWLRQQGFPFAKASWLERIHHNGGRLIYGEAGTRAIVPARRAPAPVRPARPPLPASPVASVAPAPPAAPVVPITPVRPAGPAGALARPDADVEALLALAKAYRPLAQLLLRTALAAVPGADVRAERGHIVLAMARPFAVILPGPKDVRLYLPASTAPWPAWVKAKVPPGLDGVATATHMLALTDARQLTEALSDAIAVAAGAA